MTAPLLEVDHLNVRFPTEDGSVHAVRDVSFTLNHGDVLGVVGESGCGKSVTAMALMGLLPRSARIEGSIKFEGDEIVGLKGSELVRFRGNKIGMIFQDPMTSLNPVYTVGWQITETIRAHNDMSKKAAKARASALLQLVGIPEPARRLDNYPHEFSGGMRQRVMIAMAMANDPQVLIADEPTTALDVTVQAQILETLLEVKKELNAAILLITHDLAVVASMADRVQVMYAGSIVESGTVDDIYYRTRMPYTSGLLGAIPSLAGKGHKLNQIKGSTPSLIKLKPGCPFSNRCPLVAERCLAEEPMLGPTDGEGHLAACHRWRDLVGKDGRLLFREETPV